mgnify:FL=1
MLTHRCPWCGEKIKITGLKSPSCQKCKKPVHMAGRKILFILFILYIALGPYIKSRLRVAIRISDIEHLNIYRICYYGISLLFLLCILLVLRRPYKRQSRSIQNIVSVYINWYRRSEGGVIFPRWQAPNGEIFPACFMDEKGVPISKALCVVLDYIKWSGSRSCKCTIQFVLDDIESETYFQKGNRLYLYYDYRKIAEGVVE